MESEEIKEMYAPYDIDGLVSLPTTLEIRDRNFDTLYRYVLNTGAKVRDKVTRCWDGEEYEIIEIRGPKASGFFIWRLWNIENFIF